MTQMGVDLNTIPYSGTGPAMNALLAGRSTCCEPDHKPLIKDGRSRCLAVTTLNRLAVLRMPTLARTGMTGLRSKVWHGMYAERHLAGA
jgi:tripartite-type tricarboxylate transporter receptor subunit TctC